MPPVVPDFIQRSGIADEAVAHAWDDADPEYAYVRMDERLGHRIGKTTDRGALALSIGVAEWITWRFHKQSDGALLFDKIEAMWAGVIDWRYLSGAPLPDRREWSGPVRGPLWSAADWLDRIVSLLRRRVFAWPEAVCICQLMLRVTGAPPPFKEWRRFAIGRLAKLYPRDRENLLGSPMPRQFLDPDVEFVPSMTPALLDAFLRGLNPARNPFLAAPDDMRAAGFGGEPYTFSGVP